MTRDLAVAHTCRATAMLELAAATWLATHAHWWTAVLTACTAPSLLLVAAGATAAHHRARAEAQRVVQLECGEHVRPFVPCCSFWRNSSGQVHGPDCTRPRLPLPRRDRYRLNPADQAAFESIARSYDDRSTA